MTGEAKSLCVQPSTVYIAAQCRGSSVKYGKFKSEQCAAIQRHLFMTFHQRKSGSLMKGHKYENSLRGGINMSKDQIQNEIRYQLAKELLMRMLFRNLITQEEFNQINSLNLQTFQPAEAKLYEKNSRCVTEKQVSFA